MAVVSVFAAVTAAGPVADAAVATWREIPSPDLTADARYEERGRGELDARVGRWLGRRDRGPTGGAHPLEWHCLAAHRPARRHPVDGRQRGRHESGVDRRTGRPGDPWGESPYAGRLTASGWAPATNGIAPGAVPTAVATRGSTTILVGYRPAVYPARAPELDDLAAVRGSNRVWGGGSQPRLHGSLLKNFALVAVNR